VSDIKQLMVWKRSVEVARGVYTATRRFPRDELYGLTSQARRASISITANIAEGCGRHSSSDQARFLRIAMGSAREIECLLIVSTELEILPSSERDSLCALVREVQRMLSGLIRHRLTQGQREA
jgi:four helix bundle protein